VDSEEVISASVSVRARKALSEWTTKSEKKIEPGSSRASKEKLSPCSGLPSRVLTEKDYAKNHPILVVRNPIEGFQAFLRVSADSKLRGAAQFSKQGLFLGWGWSESVSSKTLRARLWVAKL
jgi:hypothetical protein